MDGGKYDTMLHVYHMIAITLFIYRSYQTIRNRIDRIDRSIGFDINNF